MKKLLLFLVFFVLYGQAIDDDQYSYEDLIKIQTILLDSYSSNSDQSIALSLSEVSFKIAELLMQSYIENNDPSIIKDAVDSLDISISIFLG